MNGTLFLGFMASGGFALGVVLAAWLMEGRR